MLRRRLLQLIIWWMVCALTSPNTVVIAQQSPAATRSQSDKRLWQQTRFPLVKSLAELRKLQAEYGYQEFEIDFEAQLTFSAEYWTVFFVYEGELPAMVRCTDAASAILHTQPVGQGLRIRGIVYAGVPEICLLSLDLLPKVPELNPLKVENLRAKPPVPLDTFVQIQCQLREALDKPSGTEVFSMVGTEPLELHVQHRLSDRQYLDVKNKEFALVRGTLSPMRLENLTANYALRLMSNDQLESTSVRNSVENRAHEIEAKSTTIRGQVLFSDDTSEVLVGNDSGIVRVSTHFSHAIPAGWEVSVSGLMQESDGTPRLQAAHTIAISQNRLTAPQALDLNRRLTPNNLPKRCGIEGDIIGQERIDNLRRYRLRAGRYEVLALVKESSESQGPNLRNGDHVRVVGTPLLEKASMVNGEATLNLYLVSLSDVQFISAGKNLPMSLVALIGSLGGLLVGLVVTWNWMLQRQVSFRTKRLNSISSHLRMSFDAISEAVLINDSRACVAGFNRQFATLFGASPLEGQPIDNSLAVIRKRLVDPHAFLPLTLALEGKTDEPITATLELECPAQIVHAFVAAIVDNSGARHGHLWTFDDVTEKQHLENELIQSQKMEAVGQLSGGIAHDFNNLLTIVRLNLALLGHANQSRAQYDCLTAAEIAVSRAAELTQQLLDFSRRSRLDYQIVDLNSFIKQIGCFLQRSFDRSIELQIEPSLHPIPARVDVTRLEQVLINLCINSRDAMQGRAGKIAIRTSQLDDAEEGQRWAIIEVEDNGCGMSREVQQRIFEPFFTTKKPGAGTGLGLSMAHGVIQQLGGTIDCSSTPNAGTCFRIELPLATGQPDAPLQAEPSSAISARQLRLLLVDDEVLIRSTGKEILAALGHETLLAANGREALDLLQTETVDAVLLDLTMPVMSGKEAFFEIRRRWPSLPVAICSGYLIDTQSWTEAPDGQPPRILQKPYSIAELSAFLDEIAVRPVCEYST